MPYYVRAGSLPAQRHTQFRRPDGGLYAEELFSTKGFSGEYSLLYHLHPPTAILDVRAWERPASHFASNEPLRNRHFRTPQVTRNGDAVDARIPILANDELRISVAETASPMRSFYRNSGGDELLFVHRGSGTVETPFGNLPYRAHDYLSIPCGTTYRLLPSEATRLVVYESSGHIAIPRQFLTEVGQLAEAAPYYERDLHIPALLPPHEEPGPFEIRVKAGDRHALYTVEYHPFDLVGWDGYCYPYALSADDYAPIVGKLHQPPPVHAVFEAPGAAFCVFVPRLFDFHPNAVPVPYNHSNVDCDEVIYYVSGNFMSRRGIAEGSITLHAAGAPHGPHPGAVEASLGKSGTDEVAVMVDSFRPLRVADDALACEDPEYLRSWSSAHSAAVHA
ncbi:MAG: homogentisate 1,2-dioxygenase [Vulcanimicrobiaceae bacterium]